MLSSHNILSPAHGKPLTVPSQDLVLGLYYLTRRKEGRKGEGRGFAQATYAGISIGVDDMRIPEKKQELVARARKDVLEVENQRQQGAITDGERHNKIIDIWHRITESVSDEMFKEMKTTDGVGGGDFNPIFMMADSGARGSKEQVRQLLGMRGPMSKPSGEVMEQPIISNCRQGRTALEDSISTHGAR